MGLVAELFAFWLWLFCCVVGLVMRLLGVCWLLVVLRVWLWVFVACGLSTVVSWLWGLPCLLRR